MSYCLTSLWVHDVTSIDVSTYIKNETGRSGGSFRLRLEQSEDKAFEVVVFARDVESFAADLRRIADALDEVRDRRC